MLEDKDANSSPSQNNEFDSSCAAYLRRAVKACAAGDEELGLHLYLAAYEKGTRENGGADADAAFALRKAWVLAVKLKERSLAEYIFEKLEPLMDPNELAVCAGQLQSMALEKLEEFGLSREELQEMTDMISQDFLGLGGPARLMKVEHLTLPSASAAKRHAKPAAPSAESNPEADAAPAPEAASDAAPPVHDDAPAASAEASSDAAEEPVESASASEPSANPAEADGSAALVTLDAQPDDAAGKMAAEADESAVISSLENITYKDLAGFDRTIKTMRDFGIGMQDDPEFQGLVTLLNYRHGLERMPAADSFLFRSPAREDAHRFMTATLGEIGLPAIRMHMEENLQGAPVLCVMAQADNHPRLNSARNAFEGPGVLMLEDLDLWEAPVVDADDDLGGFVYATLSRGAREAINLIRSAVENPDVFVIASASDGRAIDGFFYDLLEPLTVVDIDYPDEDERRAIWLDILHDHPSMRGINLDDLVEFSAGMPRYDLYMAAREAIEDAYKTSLMHRNYVPVTTDNLFEKLAAYQPLDSKEYHALENAVVREFSRGLDGSIDDLLKG
ncbi:MAG TPA: ribonucleotide reductase subunit alpha [Candidatus Aphodovivens avicola]|nr:ribonucleotide reductase subunit alpha [Candidatus Aphodovivens avicola]